MDGYVNKLDYTDEEKVMEYCKNIIKAVEMTHEVLTKSKLRSKKANDAIATGNKKTMWNVLQEYLHNYPKLLAASFGVCICRVDADFYAQVTEADIEKQLKIVVGLIYAYEATHCAAKEKIKACFKKLLKKSGVFSDKEIERLIV